VGVVVGGLLLASGCGEDRYQVRMGPAEALEGAAAYDLVLLRVTCQQLQEAGGIGDRGWVVRRSQWQAGQSPPDLGEVEPGRYALVGIARGADCAAGWAGCIDVELERGRGETLEVTLQAFGGSGCLPNEICAGGGICTDRPQCDNVSIACDNDGDGYLACAEGLTPPPCDCWDEGADVHPGAEELCDGFDNDCTGVEDDNPECAACLDSCPEFDEDMCERPDCTTGECQILPRRDGAPCNADTQFCCGGDCVGECDPTGAPETQDCGVAGTQSRTCGADCMWDAWSACEEPADCEAGQTRADQPCGNCRLGLQDERCEGGTWVPDGACVGAGACAPGTTRPATCTECGVGEDTCLPDCTWEIGPCEPDAGDPCVDPEVCCPNGACGEDGAECCGTDVSTCGPAPLCRDWACDLGNCTEVPEEAGTDPEDECGAQCCNGAGACAAC